MIIKNTVKKTAVVSSAVTFLLFAVLLVGVLVGCVEPLRDNPYDPKSEDYRIGIITQDPANETVITGDQTITIQFTDSMNNATLKLGGDLGGASSSWSTTEKPNDTLELSPSGLIWPTEGPAKSLSIICESVNGISTGSIGRQYEVFYGYCVSTSGLDSDPGTADAPFLTLQKAISDAASTYFGSGLPDEATVRVQTGVYHTDWQANTNRITLSEAVSLYGGYNADFSSRSLDASQTKIIDDSDNGGVNWTDPNRAIDCGSGISDTTTIDGFSIQAGGGSSSGDSYAAAIFCHDGSAPTIRNNIITGGYTAGATWGILTIDSSPTIIQNEINGGNANSVPEGITYGIQVEGVEDTDENGSIVVASNWIFGGGQTDAYISRGLYMQYVDTGDTAEIYLNSINGGGGADKSYGIHIRQCHSDNIKVYNNIVYGGATEGTASYGICLYWSNITLYNNTIIAGNPVKDPSGTYVLYLIDNAESDISNNIICAAERGGDSAIYAIFENDSGSQPSFARNNCFYDLDDVHSSAYVLYRNDNGNEWDLSDLNTQVFAGSNVQADPSFVDIDGSDNELETMSDNNWELSVSTPASITEGGLNGELEGWGFDDDYGGTDRDDPWSIGANEY